MSSRKTCEFEFSFELFQIIFTKGIIILNSLLTASNQSKLMNYVLC